MPGQDVEFATGMQLPAIGDVTGPAVAGPGPVDTGRLYGRIAIYTLLDSGAGEFDRLAERVVDQVRTGEPDTLAYVVHSVPSAPLQRILYQLYADRSAYDRHQERPYVADFESRRAAAGAGHQRDRAGGPAGQGRGGDAAPGPLRRRAMPPAAHAITLLSRPGCHLCDSAREVIARVAADLGVPWEERDITGSDADLRDYWDKIPVTLIDGVQHDFWRVSEERLRTALSG